MVLLGIQIDDKSGGCSTMERQRHTLWDIMSLLLFGYSHGRPLFTASLMVLLFGMECGGSMITQGWSTETRMLSNFTRLKVLFSVSWMQFQLSGEFSKKLRMTKMLKKKQIKISHCLEENIHEQEPLLAYVLVVERLTACIASIST